MVATCESNENGRFSAQLGLAKTSLEGKSKMLFFSERHDYFEEKNNTGCLYSCQGLAICKRGVKLSFRALPKNFDFVWFLWGFAAKTYNNVKSAIAWNASFNLASPSFKNAGPNNSPIFNRRIEASVLEVISSRKLQHVFRSYKHEAFQKVKYTLDLIEQPYFEKIHSR